MQRQGWPSVPALSRPSGRDIALAAVLLVVGLVEATWLTAGERPLAPALVLALTLPLLWRRSIPSVVALAVTAALVVQLPWASVRLFDQTFTGFVCVLLAMFALGRHGCPPWAVAVLAACALAVALVLGWYDRSLGSFLLGIVFVLSPAVVGRVVASRARLRELVDRQGDLLRENAEVAERTRVAQVRGRIAGEVQQLVSRRVKEMVDRAGAARRLAPSDGAAAAELAATVEGDGRAALEEMRSILGVLRSADLSGWGSLEVGAASPSAASPAGSVPWQRVELLLVAALSLLVVGELLASPGEFPVVSLTMVGPLLAFAVGFKTTGRTAAVGLGLALGAIAVINLLVIEGGWEDYVFPWALVVLAWLGGRSVREQNDLVERSRCRAAALEHRAEVQVAAATTSERMRLARELHDVLAHTLMVMVVQAGAARRSLESGRAGAEGALRVVEETGRDASTELRRLLTLVDPQFDSTEADFDGAPGVHDLPSLVDRARAAGLVADMVVAGDPVPIPGGLALAVHRVAQEAVTNVIRHAEAQHVHLMLAYAPGQLQLEVRDDGRAVAGTGGISGNGITGMRERVEIYGGTLVAGPATGRGFVVAATFPLVHLLQEQPA